MECKLGVEMGGLSVKHGHRLGSGQGWLSPEGVAGCDCRALQKVRLTLQRLLHVCTARTGVAKELKLLFFAAGSRLNRLQVTGVCGRAGLCTS